MNNQNQDLTKVFQELRDSLDDLKLVLRDSHAAFEESPAGKTLARLQRRVFDGNGDDGVGSLVNLMGEVQSRLDALEKWRDTTGSRGWDVIKTVITAVVAALVGYIFAKLGGPK